MLVEVIAGITVDFTVVIYAVDVILVDVMDVFLVEVIDVTRIDCY